MVSLSQLLLNRLHLQFIVATLSSIQTSWIYWILNFIWSSSATDDHYVSGIMRRSLSTSGCSNPMANDWIIITCITARSILNNGHWLLHLLLGNGIQIFSPIAAIDYLIHLFFVHGGLRVVAIDYADPFCELITWSKTDSTSDLLSNSRSALSQYGRCGSFTSRQLGALTPRE